MDAIAGTRFGPSGIVRVEERVATAFDAQAVRPGEPVPTLGIGGNRFDIYPLRFASDEAPRVASVTVVVGDPLDAGLHTVASVLQRWPVALPEDWMLRLWKLLGPEGGGDGGEAARTFCEVLAAERRSDDPATGAG